MVARSALVDHTAHLLARGSVHHDDRCPTCAAFWRRPFDEQKAIIIEAGQYVRDHGARYVRDHLNPPA